MPSPHTVRWGILATGGIAQTFTKDLLVDPLTRGVSDIQHTVTAAASSSSADRAKKFLQDCNCPSDAAAYGSYEELVKDKNVDIIYVATPHSHHYQNTMLALLAGKHVLCEKAFTVNAAQTKKLVETAKSKNLFLMEAVWTRYFPLSMQIREMIEHGEIGAVHRVIADLSVNEDVEKTWGTEHRMVNMDLAGGALLDRKSPHVTMQCL
ncbi:D-xylose 1-dehydrogenase (NADP(+)) [Lignoscripta atroalba]|nr:D-xylose 1-dehydrogenase (NADP(+)) [Lignoscripta atroalba]